ncbi:MAG: hypothetical protein KME03_18785 [Aphanocapsa lilacina HA4352-LM1]|jgi:hypothetical protein|nr:hypothetical protein [Aphanocapsa lilacina HA4352-LM1]
MTFFNFSEPVLRRKQHELDVQDQRGLLKIHVQIGRTVLISTVFTRIDQVFWGWGLLCALIFATAQFVPIDWSVQAVGWTVLSLAATAWMGVCTWFWAKVERATSLVLGWGGLMLFGLVLTDFSIAVGWAEVMVHLGVLWLVLSAVGYGMSGFALRSRALLMVGVVHLAAAAAALLLTDWQFLIAGGVLSGCLALLGSTQWDMRLPIDYNLPQEALALNRLQHERRLTGGAASR